MHHLSLFFSQSIQPLQLTPLHPDILLTGQFLCEQQCFRIALTPDALLLCGDDATPQAACPFSFQLRSEIIYPGVAALADVQGPNSIPPHFTLGTPRGFRLEHQGQPSKVELLSDDMEAWVPLLERLINQRGFHQQFRPKCKIGRGAFATVYLVERLRDGREMAVKAFSKEKQFASDKGRPSLENEITLMRRLSHNHLVRLEGVYETENSIYLVLEYLRGKQLSVVLRSEERKKLCVKTLMREILEALAYLSAKRVIHRDLKPENIIFRDESCQELVICDFGLATWADEANYLFVRCGTPGFVAPEIINIRDFSVKSEPISDVFSAGVIFHHLLFGKSVFRGSAYPEILQENRRSVFDFSEAVYGAVDAATLGLLQKMLFRDPGQRVSAAEALQDQFFSQQLSSPQLTGGEECGCKAEELTEATRKKPRKPKLG